MSNRKFLVVDCAVQSLDPLEEVKVTVHSESSFRRWVRSIWGISSRSPMETLLQATSQGNWAVTELISLPEYCPIPDAVV